MLPLMLTIVVWRRRLTGFYYKIAHFWLIVIHLRHKIMTKGLASSLSYIPTVPASSLVTIGAIATGVRKREGMNNINRPMPKCFPVQSSNCSLTFRH